MNEVVTPAKVTEGNALGCRGPGRKRVRYWIPAFAGMTKTLDFIAPDQYLPRELGQVAQVPQVPGWMVGAATFVQVCRYEKSGKNSACCLDETRQAD
ncbi:MAG: hypothetical protein KBD39_11325 [Sterolibacterium sp.]|nr:hypothetical protein [Sterolibacterium sp.]MBP9800694.1 hypothetical protein [Sterolibacterium sp.]